MEILEITSRENATFKELLQLTDKKWRRRFGKCIIEGEKIVRENLSLAEKVFVRKKNQYIFKDIFPNAIILCDKLFDLITDLETDQGILAIVPKPHAHELTFPYLVLDGVQDPGNVGALLRSALAFGFNTVICLDSVCVWSPKVLRASSGVQFNLNLIEHDSVDFIKPTDALLLAADLCGESVDKFLAADSKFGLVLGSEGRGLSPRMKDFVDRTVTIPMNAVVESLNVAVAGGILMYELSNAANCKNMNTVTHGRK